MTETRRAETCFTDKQRRILDIFVTSGSRHYDFVSFSASTVFKTSIVSRAQLGNLLFIVSNLLSQLSNSALKSWGIEPATSLVAYRSPDPPSPTHRVVVGKQGGVILLFSPTQIQCALN